MSLAGGDLTTPARLAVWLASPPTLPSNILNQLIGSMSDLIYGKLDRARTFSQTFTRTLDATGTYQILLPDYPVTSIASVQLGARIINPSQLPPPGQAPAPNFGYGYRFVPWTGDLPGNPAVLEFVNGVWSYGVQNVKVTYNAGYLIQNEPATVPNATPWQVTVQQPKGLWCKDGGVTYANGTPLTPVASAPTTGEYIPPPDTSPGLYTFAAGDANAQVLISYSFIPASLEEAVCQMVAERYAYRGRVGEISKSLGGQETIRYNWGDTAYAYRRTSGLPPQVMDLIAPYMNVIPPAIGAPV